MLNGRQAAHFRSRQSSSSPVLKPRAQAPRPGPALGLTITMTLTFSHLSADSFESHLKAGRKRPRHREAVSCWQCRSRKIRCDRELPCKPCQDRGVPSECTYNQQLKQSEQKPHSRPRSARAASKRPGSKDGAVAATAAAHVSQADTPPDSASSSRADTPELLSSSLSLSFGTRDGSRTQRLPPSCTSNVNAFQGSASKTRMIGLSHWMAPCNEMTVIKAMLNRADEFQASRKAFAELKAQIRMHNAFPACSLSPSMAAESTALSSQLPDRHTCEKWVAQYCRAYGRIYNVVDFDALIADLDRIYQAPLAAHPVHLARILLVVGIAMQNVESERLNGRRLSRLVEDYVRSPPKFQKPCVGVVQVLLLLIIIKTISASDTDKMYDLMGVQGLASQIVASMGLHRDPALFVEVTPYYAEVRKRLWGCFLRLNLDYCIRSGAQFALRLDESDCPLPTTVNLRTLGPFSFANNSTDQPVVSDEQSEADAAFGITAIKLAKLIAPVFRAIHSPKPPEPAEMHKNLRAAFGTLLAELPATLRPGTSTPTSDPVAELQQSLISIPMHSFLSIVTLGFTLGTPADISQRSHLMEMWDYASSVLHQFQSLCQGPQREICNMAYHLLWTDAGRAALSACWIVGRLRRLDSSRIMSPHPQHTVFVFQQLLTKSLSFLCQLWHSKFHLGPVAAKTSLLFAISLNVTSNLYLDSEGTSSSDDNRHKKLFEEGVAAAERLIADMKETLAQRQASSSPAADLAAAFLDLHLLGACGSDFSNQLLTWPSDGTAAILPEPSAAGSSDSNTPLLLNDLVIFDLPGDTTSFSTLLSNISFPTNGYEFSQDSIFPAFEDPFMESLWE
ncbi:hypothetical protein QBC46DRAFT_379873 [Diplogelasinospora grovesii]|uniref:Zn(2)-C6 fungal-type domain-containing protein n=1 Tax=Diplogelasinospora grovesii TaxID=303347 RepID=A0AAN6S658_9PEZI|nr:hypothetical protein QBC46DRAFT_379873 [Diplogelasinospora grovesii]